ncbi:hypothetical protein [Candidatus Hecatella orcuttiae]|uniref:hypothetical protein n=1 Tax=Candidatus Hecatella orcuttiae TaxID=1935119 RepID=UPI002868177D|nr:hypothetical protein [Candidatus Hecatella orcuttiae]
MKFSVRLFFHLRSPDPYLDAKRAAQAAAARHGAVFEGVDDTLNGLYASLEPGAKEVMAAFTVEQPTVEEAREAAERLYRRLQGRLRLGFMELPNPEDRVVVERSK